MCEREKGGGGKLCMQKIENKRKGACMFVLGRGDVCEFMSERGGESYVYGKREGTCVCLCARTSERESVLNRELKMSTTTICARVWRRCISQRNGT